MTKAKQVSVLLSEDKADLALEVLRLRAEQAQTLAANAALVARMREALEFYADQSNYRGRMDVRGYQDYQLIAAPIDQDNRGDRARAALSPAAGNGGA